MREEIFVIYPELKFAQNGSGEPYAIQVQPKFKNWI